MVGPLLERGLRVVDLDVSDSSERSGDVVRWMRWANCLVSVRFMDLSGTLGG